MEQSKGNPIAELIDELDLNNNLVIMSLEDLDSNEKVKVKVLIHESAYANVRFMFDKYYQSKEKSSWTLEFLQKAMQNVTIQTEKQL